MTQNAIYEKIDGKHCVKIYYKKEVRIFRVYSQRAGITLVELVKAFPDGVTKKSMNRIYTNLTDNKMFDELRGESAFRNFMFKDGRREQVEVNKLDLDLLWGKTQNLSQPIWFGIESQKPLEKFLEPLKQRDGFQCNITKIPLLETPEKYTFAKNMRKKSIDHRKPRLKDGLTKLENLQLLSDYVNERKKQICSICPTPDCNNCALAWPEKTSIIFPTKEDISYWRHKP